MTWTNWGAIDRYKADNPQILLSVERPITPPTDDENAVTISTPRAVTPLLHAHTVVPGQPRKTPGAKTRHAVSAPETVDAINDDVFVDQLEMQDAQKRAARGRSKSLARETSCTPSDVNLAGEQMQLVVDEVLIVPIPHREAAIDTLQSQCSNKQTLENESPPVTAYIANSQGIREITPPTLLDGNGMLLNGHHAGVTVSPGKPFPTSKIGKPRQQRPLTTITDNRQVDKIPTIIFNDTFNNALRPVSGGPRSKGASNGPVTEHENGSNFSSNERYNLRAGRTAAPLTSISDNTSPHNASVTTSVTILPQIRPHSNGQLVSSPSRLPRVTKNRGPAKLGVTGAGGPVGISAPSTRSVSGSRKVTVGVNVTSAVAVAAVAPVTTSTRLSRNTRKQRSSTGEA